MNSNKKPAYKTDTLWLELNNYYPAIISMLGLGFSKLLLDGMLLCCIHVSSDKQIKVNLLTDKSD